MTTTLAWPQTKTGLILVVVCAAPLLGTLNYSTPLILVPQTAAHLDAGSTGQTWVMNAIALGLAVPLLAVGSLADNIGRKSVFVIGAAVLAAAILVAAMAPSTPVFVLARIMQGAASAALLTTSLGIIGQVFPSGPQRLRASGAYGAMSGGGVAGGVLLGAILDAPLGWNGAYWLYAAAAAGLALAAHAVLPESRAQHPRRIDVAGTVTLGLGLAALMSGLAQGRQSWTDPAVIVLLAVAAVFVASFAVVEARSQQPMLDLGLFRRRLFIVATAGALVLGMAVISMMSYLPTVLQQENLSAMITAWVFTIWAGTAFLASLQAKRIRLPAGHMLSGGLVLSAAGGSLLHGIAADWSWWQATPALMLSGIGYGIANSALTRLAIDSVPSDRGSMGSGVNNTARYIGTSIGIPILVAIVSAAGVDAALWTCAAVAVASAGVFLPLSRR